MIDIILTTLPEFHYVTNVKPLSLSDHYLVETKLRVPKVTQSHKTIRFRDYKNFNLEHFHHELAWTLDQANLTSFTDPECAWNEFKNIFVSMSNAHAPFKEIRVKNRKNPWISKDILSMMYRRDYLKEKSTNIKSQKLWDEYKILNKEILIKIESSKVDYYQSSCNENKNNPTRLWRTLKSCLPNKHSSTVYSDKITAESLNKFYTLVGENIAKRFDHIPNKIHIKGTPSLYEMNLSPVNPISIQKTMNKLPNKSSNDIFDFDCKLLRLNSSILAPVLSHIFNLSISTGIVPKDFKLSRITPVYKGKGHVDDEASYRPISISCHVSKLLEHEVNSQLISYLTKHSFISPDQSAYLKFHSTTTCLHRVVDDWLQNMDDGMITGACFLDIEKCFNTINHDLLLQQLNWYGICNNERNWFKSYLANRSQCTFYDGKLSDILDINIGIPQGSVLGPALFLVFILEMISPREYRKCFM